MDLERCEAYNLASVRRGYCDQGKRRHPVKAQAECIRVLPVLVYMHWNIEHITLAITCMQLQVP